MIFPKKNQVNFW